MHPDLHPDQTQEEKELFINAIKAYKNGDVATIRLIYTMKGEATLPKEKEGATKTLYREKERLTKVLAALRDEIVKIRSEFPFTVEEMLNDEEKIVKKQADIKTFFCPGNGKLVN